MRNRILLLFASIFSIFQAASSEERLEIRCIEDREKYCSERNVKGFIFNDGCRLCKCLPENKGIKCKQGRCEYFAKSMDEAIDYCEKLQEQNDNTYKKYAALKNPPNISLKGSKIADTTTKLPRSEAPHTVLNAKENHLAVSSNNSVTGLNAMAASNGTVQHRVHKISSTMQTTAVQSFHSATAKPNKIKKNSTISSAKSMFDIWSERVLRNRHSKHLPYPMLPKRNENAPKRKHDKKNMDKRPIHRNHHHHRQHYHHHHERRHHRRHHHRRRYKKHFIWHSNGNESIRLRSKEIWLLFLTFIVGHYTLGFSENVRSRR